MKRLKKVWKWVKRTTFWVFFIGLFFTTVTTVILHIYEDDIKAFAISELNSHLNTDVEVQNIELSIFHDFPNASLAFENVFIADAYKEVASNDTLLFAEELFFHFNIWDIWSGDYKVKRASIHQGQINLKATAGGDFNYGIVKASEEKKDTTDNFSFLLELLKVEDVFFSYANQATGQTYDILIAEALLRGDFAETEYQLLAEGDLQVDRVKSGSLTLISDKSAALDLALNINTANNRYAFEQGDLTVEEMEFGITGYFDSAAIDIVVEGRQIEVDQVFNSLIPEDAENKRQYDGEGLVDFNGSIKGNFSRQHMPAIEADFSVKNGAIVEPENKLKITGINAVGSYRNAQENRTDELVFDSFGFRLLNSHFEGNGKMVDFERPTFTTKARGQLDLASFHRFFAFNNVEELAGNVQLDLTGVLRFSDPEYRKDKFEIISSNGNIRLDHVVYKGSGSDLRLADISGDIVVKGKDAAAKNLSVKTNQSDVVLNGAMKNLVNYIEGSGSLGLIASVESQQIVLEEFLGTPNKEREGPPTLFQLPDNLNLNLEMHVNRLEWDGHTFETITGKLLMANRKINARRIKMKTLEGSVSGELELENRLEKGNVIEGKLNFSNVNIKKLFAEWDNFQQTSITDQHLSGRVTGRSDFLLLFNPYFSLIEDKIYTLSDIRITNGAMVNLETMKAITDYMRSNTALKVMLNKHIDRFEEKLMNLQFSELKNKIEIKNRRIHIPKMTVRSNALDVGLFGWHDFDNHIEYHFSFRFRELKTKPEYTEFGKVEDDGLGILIYMTMAGTIDEPVFSLDKDERKNEIKASMEEEKATVKSVLKTEFGLFKKDSTVKEMQEDNKKEVEFIFYEKDLDEMGTDTSKSTKVKNKKRVGKFFDKLKEESEKDKEDVEFESDRLE